MELLTIDSLMTSLGNVEVARRMTAALGCHTPNATKYILMALGPDMEPTARMGYFSRAARYSSDVNGVFDALRVYIMKLQNQVKPLAPDHEMYITVTNMVKMYTAVLNAKMARTQRDLHAVDVAFKEIASKASLGAMTASWYFIFEAVMRNSFIFMMREKNPRLPIASQAISLTDPTDVPVVNLGSSAKRKKPTNDDGDAASEPSTKRRRIDGKPTTAK